MLGAFVRGVVQYVVTRGKSGWTPLVVGVVTGVVVILIRAFVLTKPDDPPPIILVEPPPLESPPLESSLEPAVVRYTAAEIIESMEGLTGIQQETLLPRYIGEVIEETGAVRDVTGSTGAFDLAVAVDGHLVFAEGLTEAKIASLRVDEVVSFRGEVTQANDLYLTVKNLELLEVGVLPEPGDDGRDQEWTAPTYSVPEILAALQGLTDVAIEERVESQYKGEPLEVRGSVVDVRSRLNDTYEVTVDGGEFRVVANFSASEPVRHLRIGDLLWIRGYVEAARSQTVVLENAEVIKAGAAPAPPGGP